MEKKHWGTRTYFVKGDPFKPLRSDLFAQTALLDAKDPIPDGWTLIGDETRSVRIIGRVFHRSKLE